MSFFRSAKILLNQSRAVRAATNRIAFPGLWVDSDVQITGRALTYGAGSSIGAGSILQATEPGSIHLGEGTVVGRQVELGGGGIVTIGRYASIQDRCIILGEVDIGAYCIFAPNVYVSSGRHYIRLHPELLIREQDEIALADPELAKAHNRPVRIHEDVWIGINAVVMSGVTIGRGAVVGANAVVSRDIAPYTVVAGSPAMEVSKRLDFAPPARIDSSSQKDWPYFYSGFGHRAEERGRAVSADGLPAESRFSISLGQMQGAREVVLRVRRLGQTPTPLSHAGTTHVLNGADWSELAFPLATDRDPSQPIAFTIGAPVNPGSFGLRVSSAWLR